jgi:hypothetical protein
VWKKGGLPHERITLPPGIFLTGGGAGKMLGGGGGEKNLVKLTRSLNLV